MWSSVGVRTQDEQANIPTIISTINVYCVICVEYTCIEIQNIQSILIKLIKLRIQILKFSKNVHRVQRHCEMF